MTATSSSMSTARYAFSNVLSGLGLSNTQSALSLTTSFFSRDSSSNSIRSSRPNGQFLTNALRPVSLNCGRGSMKSWPRRPDFGPTSLSKSGFHLQMISG